MVTAVVPKNGRAERIELEILALRNVRGVVRSNGYPVIGARVTGYAYVRGTANREQTVTDGSGGFTFDTPESASEMNLVVAGLGKIFHPFKVRTDQSIVLEVASAGGELRLRWPSGSRQLVSFNDVPVMIYDLFEWGRVNGINVEQNTIALPSMAPGRYQLCVPAKCVEGVLAAGGRLELNAVDG
jgi:hypothetical protein